MTARPLSVTAELTVAAMDLVARFERAVDARDRAGFAAMFTDDGEITGSMHAGHDELADFLRDDQSGPSAHLTANHIVSVNEQGAIRIEYILTVVSLAGPSPTIMRLNRITDDLAETPQGWRIRRHDVAPFIREDQT